MTAKKKGKKPLVMAYIGRSDPHRGDSTAAVGLSRLVAKMINGRYVYVDRAMLDKSFPNLSEFSDKLRAYLARKKAPDIVIGAYGYEIEDTGNKTPILVVDDINETLSSRRAHNKELVSHNLTPEILAKAGKEFQAQYPDIKGPLVAVMMGGCLNTYSSDEIAVMARKLVAIAQNYPEITFFICPSRRTGQGRDILLREMKKSINNIAQKQETQDAKKPFNATAKKKQDPAKRITVLDVDYNEALAGYNPYLGLLATADHIVVAGESFSLVSEALFTGKNIYVYKPVNRYNSLRAQGYLRDLTDLKRDEPFPTVAMTPLDITGEIAESIVEDYSDSLRTANRKRSPEP